MIQNITNEISLPRGVSDYLSAAAGNICHIESVIKRVFDLWGFRRIITPNLEYDDVLSIGVGEELKGKTYRFEDRQSGRLLTFPPDITPQIARIVATRLQDRPLPHRISYSGRVLRQTEIQTGRNREIFQSGVELIGLDSPEADAEMVAMAVEALLNLGFEGFKIDLGQVEFCRGIIAASGLKGQPLVDLQEAITRKDSSAVALILDNCRIPESSKIELTALPRLFGGREVLAEAARIASNDRSMAALANLQQVIEILDIHGVGEYLTIDLGETRGLEYHTGVTFEGFVNGLGEPVCSGGRYDKLTARYGMEAPATGFTFNVLNLLQALERSAGNMKEPTVDFLLFNACRDRCRVLELARKLRSNGFTVARDIIRREYSLSLEYAESMNINCMLVVSENDCHAVRVCDGVKIPLSSADLARVDLSDYIDNFAQ